MKPDLAVKRPTNTSSAFGKEQFCRVGEIKQGLLGVKQDTIEKYTEVSFLAAAEMAEGARRVFGSDIAISSTGFAGPTGGNENDPVGTVYVCIASDEETVVIRTQYKDALLDRGLIRICSSLLIIEQILKKTE